MEKTGMRYKDWLREWLEKKRALVKEATWANYSVAVMNHIMPVLGEYDIAEITEERMQETVLYWLRRGRLDGCGGLPQKTVKDLVTIIKDSLHMAYKKLGLPMPEINIIYPSAGISPQVEALTAEQQKAVIAAVLQEFNSRTFGILMCLYTGMRIGELCALQWSDIDMKNGILTVSKTVQRIFCKNWDGSAASEVVVTLPKTKNAIRDIPISSFLLAMLRRIDPHDPQAFVITGKRESPEPRVYRSYYTRFLKRNDVPHIRFHGLRHTFATRCIEDGADYKTVSAILGHASVSTTLNLYVHPQMEAKRKCVERLSVYID